MGVVSESEAEADPEADDRGATPVPAHQEAQDAAQDAVEPGRLLEGEDEHTEYVDDAVHWTEVYAELLDFKQSLLDLAERRVAELDDAAESEVRDTDLKVLAAEADRFRRRLAFWQRRVEELEARSVTDSE